MNKAIGPTEIDKSLEVEIGRNIHELIGADAAFRHPENAEGEMSADNLGTLLRRVTEDRRTKLRSSLMNFRRYARSSGLKAIVFKAPSRDTRN
jgi:hypothetical protein